MNNGKKLKNKVITLHNGISINTSPYDCECTWRKEKVAMKTSNSPKVVHGKDKSKEKGLAIEISTTGGAHAVTKEFDSIDDFLDYFDYSRKHHKWLYLIDYEGRKVAIKAGNVEFVKEWG